MSKKIRAACVAASLSSITALAALPASADATAPGDRLRYDLLNDVPITIAAGAIWLGTELLKPALAPADCRWCGRNDDGTDAVNGLDTAARDAFKWSNPAAAATISDVLGFGISPATALGLTTLASGLDGRVREAPADGVLILEASFAAATLNQLVKFAFGRERPFVHALSPEDKRKTNQPSDNNLSFFSGHTNLAFALAVSSGTVAQLRGYRYAPLVWATGLPLAATIGYLRIAADKHYLTDVLTGAIAGTAVGLGIPLLFHRADAAPAAGTGSGAQALSGAHAGRGAARPRRKDPSGLTLTGVSAGPTNVSISWQW